MEIDKAILEKFGIIKNSKNVHDKPATLHEKIAAEKELELGMIRSGIRRFHKTVDKSKAKISEKTGKPRETNESTTIYGQVLIQTGLEPMNEAIEIYFQDAFNGHAKRYATEAQILSKCIPIQEVAKETPEKWSSVSFITLKAVLDSITVSSTQQKAILKIASAIEDEARLLYFKESDNKQYSQTKEWLKTKNNYRHKRRVFHYAMNRHNLEYKGLSKEEKIKLGKLLLELLAKSTGFIKLTKTFAVKGKSIIYVQATEKTIEWIENKKLHAEILKPFREPMVVKPKVWDENPYSGGYYIKDLRPSELGSTLGEPTKQSTQTDEVKHAL